MKPADGLLQEVRRLRDENARARDLLKKAGHEAADLMLKVANLEQHLEATAIARAQALARVQALEEQIGRAS